MKTNNKSEKFEVIHKGRLCSNGMHLIKGGGYEPSCPAKYSVVTNCTTLYTSCSENYLNCPPVDNVSRQVCSIGYANREEIPVSVAIRF